ncbi:hypothetical protein [Arthrospira platensis]|uniref:Uncharacterized protein n=1 Tax=Limnospira platensis NIES-46 TaxID=1236695 RepID=A0A5M3T0B6_LIMPL|nr:hypothetical protein [Arthrospira platensis]AMW31416.1 hypothetical protein AP285_29395 [Arthrospira platensis YZ]KDR56154.1 hypothetical protein APPUASWS_018705 [Arthrospira platensis str. Paraca]MBD2669824.1 hypothetical protein [Arthrospira platensis FACHB-439]MBD2710388.1 hypothetical protein [Arthrospira platensis FACHB-835]MDF2208913.1 hypothetical protein [Arthrospira platensis NCB002]MDT9310671.1 hypothetical protein [Limnospira sp. Paracas R14]QQW29327.1 hypothetical protein AP91
MKCINCGIENNFKERTAYGGRCKSCGHQFVFEPKTGSPFSDPGFQKYIESVSGPGNLLFTKKQLIYFFERKLGRKKKFTPYPYAILFLIIYFWVTILFSVPLLVSFITLKILSAQIKSENQTVSLRKQQARFLQFIGLFEIFASVILLIINPNSIRFIIFLLSVGLGLFMIYIGESRRQMLSHAVDKFPMASTELDTWLNLWSVVNGPIGKLLPPPKQSESNAVLSPDITSYSFDRLMVCDNSAIAQFLIANNFHFNHNCAIVSITGYPENIFSTILEMAKRNAELVVYAVHDATIRGVSLTHHLRNTPQWFANTTIPIYDVGLTPQQVLNSKGFFIRNSETFEAQSQAISSEIRTTLSPEEIAWLEAGNFVELESLPPAKLLQILSRQFNLNSTKWSDDTTSSYSTVDGRTSTDIAIFASSSFG